MEMRRHEFAALMLGAAAGLGVAGTAAAETDPLPSWNDGPAKAAILKFVRATTDSSSPDFVPAEERIAEFDQDGTLWVEHPLYTQIVFCLDRVPTLVKEKPELKDKEPFKVVMSGDREAIAKLPLRDIFEIVMLSQSGMTVEDYRAEVRQCLMAAKHPRWNRPYTDLVYQPMLEVLSLLRVKGFANYIATGGGASFVREYSSRVYDIPPERVCGMAQPDKFDYSKDGKPVLIYEPKVVLNNLEAGKIENFWLSDDQQILEYVKSGSGARLSAAVLQEHLTETGIAKLLTVLKANRDESHAVSGYLAVGSGADLQ
jgi:hypothetical protein